MAKITIRNNRTQKVEQIDADLWKKKASRYRGIFSLVSPVVDPPEVKELKAKAAAKALGQTAEKAAGDDKA